MDTIGQIRLYFLILSLKQLGLRNMVGGRKETEEERRIETFCERSGQNLLRTRAARDATDRAARDDGKAELQRVAI